MILRVRSPYHPPRDVDLGPGWAAHSQGHGAERLVTIERRPKEREPAAEGRKGKPKRRTA